MLISDKVGKSIDRGALTWAPCVINKDENYCMFYGPFPISLAYLLICTNGTDTRLL